MAKTLSPFEQAFAAARAAKKSDFTFNGKKYTTDLAGAKKSSDMTGFRKEAAKPSVADAVDRAKASESSERLAAQRKRAGELAGEGIANKARADADKAARTSRSIDNAPKAAPAEKPAPSMSFSEAMSKASADNAKNYKFSKGGVVKKPAAKPMTKPMAKPATKAPMSVGKGKVTAKPTGMKSATVKMSCGGMVKKKKWLDDQNNQR